MAAKYGKAKRVWVMDRGMVSEAVLDWFREGGRGYLVGAARSELRKWKEPLTDPQGWESVREGLRSSTVRVHAVMRSSSCAAPAIARRKRRAVD